MAGKNKTKPGYRITVTGVYIAANEHGNKVKKFYKSLEFDFPQIVKYKEGMKKEIVTLDKGTDRERTIEKAVPKIIEANVSRGNIARHLIRTYYLDDRLRKEYPDFSSVHTCDIFAKEKIEIDIDKCRDVSKTSIKDMDLAELNQFVTISDINVIISDYDDLADKKTAVKMALAEKERDDIAAGRVVVEEDLLEDEAESPLLG